MDPAMKAARAGSGLVNAPQQTTTDKGGDQDAEGVEYVHLLTGDLVVEGGDVGPGSADRRRPGGRQPCRGQVCATRLSRGFLLLRRDVQGLYELGQSFDEEFVRGESLGSQAAADLQ